MDFSACTLFEGLTAPQLGCIQALARRQKIRTGQWLFHKADPAEKFYLVEDGAVELLIKVQDAVELPITIEDGAAELRIMLQHPVEIPITLIRPGSGCVGVGALVAPYRYNLSARCARDGELRVIRGADMLALIAQQPELGCRVMTNLSRLLLERLNETRREVQIHFMSLVRAATL